MVVTHRLILSHQQENQRDGSVADKPWACASHSKNTQTWVPGSAASEPVVEAWCAGCAPRQDPDTQRGQECPVPVTLGQWCAGLNWTGGAGASLGATVMCVRNLRLEISIYSHTCLS